MSAESSPRARLVELLWQLKQSYDRGDGGGLRFIHFNTLLNDSEYRAEVIEQALTSDDPRIRELARTLKTANRQGVLLGRQPTAGVAGAPPAPAPTRRAGGRVWLIVLAVLLVTAGALLYRPLVVMVAGEQVVSGVLDGDTTWGADRTWILDGIVYVEGGTLTLEPGTRVEGRPGAALVVTRGARLHAAGRADAPILFTSNQPEGTRQPGDWGGLVLLGAAPVNQPDAHIEGVPDNDPRGAFGGRDADGSCGVLEYARIEFAGFEVYANNELNGLTLGGCGGGTIVRHVQVHRALDDGIELFGGSADLRHVLITGAGDDSLDWDWGWRGRVQFLIAQQYSSVGDNGFEADNNGDRHDAEPRSEPVMYNVSLISPRSHGRHHRAMTLREGTGGHFHNMVISGFSGETLDIQDASTVANLNAGRLTFQGVVVHGVGARGVSWFEREAGDGDDDGGLDEEDFFRALPGLRFGEDPMYTRNATDLVRPDYTPARNSPLKDGAVAPPQGEFWDEGALYLGAVRPGAARTWVDGWTDFPLN
ncbi:DUF3040 domain-containing protein [Alcanivorax marinus]|uniref:DUF3040 domain-containing protein n=1 Tax=Alloalcanivorax marinus TaxID=1177169 RepID=A0A9Q3UL68_9GAMM|nr:DUF3040 domain-containing protein [Alloalcanivorax marinus]MCC4308051.1 DUF3040 domain-containing protein [Alloalcanivorax marinus]